MRCEAPCARATWILSQCSIEQQLTVAQYTKHYMYKILCGVAQVPDQFDTGLKSSIEGASAALDTAYSLQENGHINQVCTSVLLLSTSLDQPSALQDILPVLPEQKFQRPAAIVWPRTRHNDIMSSTM